VISPLRKRLQAARLYLVCDELPDERLDAALCGGVQLVQLRMKSADDERILAVARRFAAVCAHHGVPLILNDRPDLVVEAGADGVHLGQDDLPVAAGRELVGAERLVGLSTHTPAQVDAADAAGADYIGVGPVHTTPTKPGRQAVGTDLVAYAARHAQVPFFAIGGITPDNVGSVLDAGARRIAVVRAIAGAQDPAAAAAALSSALAVGVRVGAA
jgi:thiamine-phosphate pyrophosphorylase